MRFEVPQFIEVEDKIFGPFTWKQFVYLAGGAGAGSMLFLLLPFILFLLVAGPIIALSAGLAFYPVNSRPLSVFLESMVKYGASSRLYLWKRQATPPSAQSAPSTPVLYTPPTSDTIAALSRNLELHALKKGTDAEPE